MIKHTTVIDRQKIMLALLYVCKQFFFYFTDDIKQQERMLWRLTSGRGI
jgi:hypothetical protein